MSTLKHIKNQGKIVLHSKFLKNLSLAERYEFLQLCHQRSYKEGEFVYYRNDPGTGMYFIESGKVELTLDLKTENNEEDIIEGYVLEAPESFGALSIGYDLRRKSSAKCIADSELLGFFKPDFEVLRDRHPQIAVKFLETLSNITLRQLQLTTKELELRTDKLTALKVQFQTYYEDPLTDEE